MPREFDGTAGEGLTLGTNATNMGDGCSRDQTWSILGMMYSRDFATDDMNIFACGDSGGNQLRFRVDAGVSPQPLEFRVDNVLIGTTTGEVGEDKWYTYALTSDGGGATGDMTAYALDMSDWTWDVDGETATMDQADVAGRASMFLQFGHYETNDEIDGHIAHIGFVNRQISKQDVASFARHPWWWFASEMDGLAAASANVQFYSPVLGATDPEPDWGGLDLAINVDTGSVGRSAISPPTGLWMPGMGGWQGAFTAAAGGGLGIPLAMHHYKQMSA